MLHGEYVFIMTTLQKVEPFFDKTTWIVSENATQVE